MGQWMRMHEPCAVMAGMRLSNSSLVGGQFLAPQGVEGAKAVERLRGDEVE